MSTLPGGAASSPSQVVSPTAKAAVAIHAERHLRARQTFDEMMETAKLMAKHSFLPTHLRWAADHEVTVANCFRIVCQARAWNLDPYTVAEQSYIEGGKLGFTGVIVNAVANNSGMLEGRLSFEKTGEGQELTITVIGTLKGQLKPKTKTLKRADVQNKNTLWGKDPEAKLYYSVVRGWVKLHTPEILIGFGEEDELPAITPSAGDEWNEAQEILVPSSGDAHAMYDEVQPVATAGALPANQILHGQLISIDQIRVRLDLTSHRLDEIVFQRYGEKNRGLLTQQQAEDLMSYLRNFGKPESVVMPNGSVAHPSASPFAANSPQAAAGYQTLQTALKDQAATGTAKGGADAESGLATQDQLRGIIDVRESIFSQMGWSDAKTHKVARDEWWVKVLAPRGVTSATKLPAAVAANLLAKMEEINQKLTAKHQDDAQATRQGTPPPAAMPLAAPK